MLDEAKEAESAEKIRVNVFIITCLEKQKPEGRNTEALGKAKLKGNLRINLLRFPAQADSSIMPKAR